MSSARFLAFGAFVTLVACARPSVDVEPSPGVGAGIRFLVEGATDGFARAVEPRRFVFPDDHGRHSGYRTEWWYFTGNLKTDRGRHFGFELTFFRIALQAERIRRESSWGTSELWMAHFALTDTEGRQFVAAERLARGALGLAGITGEPFRLWTEDWSVAGDLSGAGGTLRLTAETDQAAIDLALAGFERIVLQGDEGIDNKGPEEGNASYYYSAPRLEASGTVRSGDAEPETVTGNAWMDREWGTTALGSGVAGWDWFGIQLQDGRDLMYYRLRNRDGSGNAYSSGSLVDVAGIVRRLDSSDVVLAIEDTWLSPVTGVSYPVAWRIEIPQEGLRLQLRPTLREQELRLTVRYWEGAVEVHGTDSGVPIKGWGYLELAGY